MSATTASAVRSRLSALTTRLTLSTPAPTSDILRGTERLLLAPARTDLRASYASLFSAGKCDAVSTGTNTSVSFLDACNLFEDMSRDNDISYYVTGRGSKGVTTDGEEYAWQTQQNGQRHCVPRKMVSEGEKVAFSSLLMSLACEELTAAAAADVGGDASPLTGASVYLEDAMKAHTTTLVECVENQMRTAAAASVDCFFITGADTEEKLEVLREVVRSNEKKMVRLSKPGPYGGYALDEEETEVGFDVPAVVLREGEIHAIL